MKMVSIALSPCTHVHICFQSVKKVGSRLEFYKELKYVGYAFSVELNDIFAKHIRTDKCGTQFFELIERKVK